jgi:hypothetical protein
MTPSFVSFAVHPGPSKTQNGAPGEVAKKLFTTRFLNYGDFRAKIVDVKKTGWIGLLKSGAKS